MLKRKSKSETAKIKEDIQAYLRLIVAKRDKGCVLRNLRRCGALCEVVDDKIVSDTVIQADHLLSRANSGTFADPRLVVCVCRSCHGWKSLGSNLRKKEYDDLVRSILPKDRVELWDKCEAEMSAHKTHKMDWRLELLNLKQEYKKISTV